jgi:hypothetical protein
MQGDTEDYASFIAECRSATANDHTDVLVSTEKEEGIDVLLPSRTTREARQYLRIPWHQVHALAQVRLSVTAIYVYLLLWRQRTIRKSRTVPLTTAALAGFGFTRYQKARALACLERAGLIRVERHRGKNPLVTFCGEASLWMP